MSITTGRRYAALVATSVLIAACGGGGGGMTTPPPPPPPPVIDDGRPDGFTSEFRTDFVLPYQTPDQGITTVQAGSFTGSVLRTTDTPEFSWQERVGQWDNGAVRQDRPYQLIYLSGDRWIRLSLRDSTSSPVDTGVRESGAVCTLWAMRTDYANPARGIMTYGTAGDDQECYSDDDQVRAFRLDKSDAPTVLSTGTLVPRVFRNPATGALTGVLIQDGTTLRLYNADLSSSQLIAEGISGRVGFFGFSSSQLWASWSNGTNRAVYRIEASGTVTPVFEIASGASLSPGASHLGGALYFTHYPNTSGMSDEIIRIPSSGGSATVVHRGEDIGQVLAVAANGLIYTSDVSINGARTVHMLSFGTGTAAATDEVVGTYNTSGETPFFFRPSTTLDGRFMFSLLNVSEDGSEQMSAHLVSPGHPELSKNWQNSEWLGAVAEDINLNTVDTEPVSHGVLVKAFTGDYRTSGHGGGTLTLYSFGTNKEYVGTTVPQDSRVGAVGGTVSSPIGLTTLTTPTATPGQSTVDVFGFNLRDFVAVQVTNTPSQNEGLIFP